LIYGFENFYVCVMAKKQIMIHSGMLMVERIAGMVLNLVVSIWLARYLGVSLFGQLNYAIAFVVLFDPLYNLGLNSLVTRELANGEQPAGKVLGTALRLRLGGGLLAVGLIVLVQLWNSPDSNVFWFLWLGLGKMGAVPGVTEYWYEARQKFSALIAVRLGALLLTTGAKVLAIVLQWPLESIVIVYGVEFVLQFAAMAVLYFRLRPSGERWHFDGAYSVQLLKGSFWLILSGIASVIYLKIDQVMLGNILGDASVGVYAVAARFSEVWYFIPTAFATAYFPQLLITRKTDTQQYLAQLQMGFTVLFYASAVIAIGITWIAPYLIQRLYGAEFAQAATVLQIHVWAGVFVFMRGLVSKWLIAENLLRYSLVSHGSGAVVNIILNLVLIPQYGVQGAAWATIISYAVASYFALWVFKATRGIAWQMTLAPVMLHSLWHILQKGIKGKKHD
jgi:O-antigen/teichoic acid export membrane protein